LGVAVELVYLAWNRKVFTEASFALLRANTDWDLVDRLVVYDDCSTDGTREWLHIGGVGLIRSSAIRKPMKAHGRYGWTQYQGPLDTAWIKPDLPVVQLDLIPEEPWRSLAAEYVDKGWARYWTPYDPLQPEWWAWVAPQLARLRVKVAA
jgi:hypothetical protein